MKMTPTESGSNSILIIFGTLVGLLEISTGIINSNVAPFSVAGLGQFSLETAKLLVWLAFSGLCSIIAKEGRMAETTFVIFSTGTLIATVFRLL